MTRGSTTWEMPGRIEVLGKHTDYGGGRVLVCAVDRGVTVHAEARAGRPGTLEAVSEGYPDQLRLEVGVDPSLPDGHWGRYVQTVLERITKNFGPMRPARVVISSDLPAASGMSSSSAMICGVATALADLNDLPDTESWKQEIPDRLALAGYAASIENGKSFGALEGRPGVGTSGGSLDHTGMLAGQEGLISYAEFDPMRIIDQVALPADWSFVVGVSGISAEKTGAAKDSYNRGPAVLAAVVERWNRETGRHDATVQAALRSVVGEDLDSPLELGDERFERLLRLSEPGYERDRLDQFLVESAVLVPRAYAALRDGNRSAFAEAVHASQRLAESQLGNQVPQTVDLVRIAEDLGAHAASAFGAGFGGSVWALVPSADAESFGEAWMRRYRLRHDVGDGACALTTRPGPPGRRKEPVPA